MLNKIQKLPEWVINQIAAGEVVENPASIVKELIENSLDAAAKRISIDLVAGGQQLIRIDDDGCGMSPEDALFSIERHATSKISTVEDLNTLTTMGFRGEALAAISSVSHFEIKTSNGVGTQIVIEGGQVVINQPIARNRGTTIEVRSLFYNVPARKKFQKSVSANAAQVGKVIESIALAHPDVTFIFNGREFLAAGQKERIAEILGEHEHFVKKDGITLFLRGPQEAMATRLGQYVFINKRPIFSPLIAKAVKAGFGTRIGEHAYPKFVIFLDVDPELVDVNVHPQKKEVRFSDEAKIFRLVQRTVEGTFEAPFSPKEPLVFTPPAPFSFPPVVQFEPQEFIETAPALPLFFSDRLLTCIGSLLLVQREGLILVDLAAAHARVLFEALKSEKGTAQALIWPLEFALAPSDEGISFSLNEVGIECRELKKMLVIDALPPCLEAATFPQFLATWKEGKKIDQVASRFCRAVKKNYNLDEAGAIWRQLQTCRDSLYDPIGNIIWKEIAPEALWTLFGSKE